MESAYMEVKGNSSKVLMTVNTMEMRSNKTPRKMWTTLVDVFSPGYLFSFSEKFISSNIFGEY